jgi:hypothetical protein
MDASWISSRAGIGQHPCKPAGNPDSKTAQKPLNPTPKKVDFIRQGEPFFYAPRQDFI